MAPAYTPVVIVSTLCTRLAIPDRTPAESRFFRQNNPLTGEHIMFRQVRLLLRDQIENALEAEH
jgi:hypothetical protein